MLFSLLDQGGKVAANSFEFVIISKQKLLKTKKL